MSDFLKSIQYLHELLQVLPLASPVARVAMLRLAAAHLHLLAGQEAARPPAMPAAPGNSGNSGSGQSNRGGRYALQ